MSLLEEYKGSHPPFESKPNFFPEKIRVKLIRKLTNETNKDNFLSTISEISFGKLFSEMGIELEYEKRFEKDQRPKWFLSLKNSRAICDVYNFNRSNKDQIKNNFQSELIEKVGQIKASYFIKITFLIKDFQVDSYNVEDIVLKIEKWFGKKS